jgi:hypothetical protein
MQPTYVRLFIVYVCFVTIASTIRALVIAWRLYAGTFRPVISVKQLCSDGQPIDLARTALANGIRQRSTHDLEHIMLSESNAAVFSQHLRSTESNFLALWKAWRADLRTLRRLALLTLLLSFAVLLLGAVPTFFDLYNNGKLTASTALLLTTDQLLSRLALGLFSCAILYAEWLVLERVLIRRRLSWTLFTELVRNKALEIPSTTIE